MSTIKLPARFEAILKKNQDLYGATVSALADFGVILDDNSMFFFGAYTEHGSKHISDVLETADRVIQDETYLLLGPEDICVLSISILIHDLGMHLHYKGFCEIIKGCYDDIMITDLDSLRWGELWDEFVTAVKKFNNKQNLNVFGDQNPKIQVPNLDGKDFLDKHQRSMIGEFIRRNHARLAHEIAIKGLIIDKESFLKLPRYIEINEKFKDIIGIVARSHGMEIRDTFTYLEKNHGLSTWHWTYGVHNVFLMCVVRMSDYLQIHRGRTHETLIRLKSYSSPISILEHESHLAIEDIKFKHNNDPEKIFVSASPKTNPLYLKLVKLFKDIQYEFDISWAVLGEIYGKDKESDRPMLRYRRISSNIQDPLFWKNQSYISDHIALSVDAELVKLLVNPLYGSNPNFGVRELLQNAIDACNEREFISRMKNESYEPLVTVQLSTANSSANQSASFVISDNGKGMTLNEIQNYFLRVGASFRHSGEWKRRFLDDEGNAALIKSGRFGIGVLAGFLIGDKIIVQTKTLGQECGYKFSFRLDATDIIEVHKDYTLTEIGTTIHIEMDKKQFEIFEKKRGKHRWYRWYTLQQPRIKYLFNDEEVVPFTHFDPSFTDATPNTWHELPTKFDKVRWSYNGNSGYALICNGIGIKFSLTHTMHRTPSYITQLPAIQIFDFNAQLQLNLSRNNLTEPLPFFGSLIQDIKLDAIAALLCSKSPFVKFKHSSGIEFSIFNGRSQFRITGVPNEKYFSFTKLEAERYRYSSRQYWFNTGEKFISNARFNDSDYFNGKLSEVPRWLSEVARNSDEIIYCFTKNAEIDAFLKNTAELYPSNLVLYQQDNYNTIWTKELLDHLNNDYSSSTITLIYEREGEGTYNDPMISEVFNLLGDTDVAIPYDIEERKIKFKRAFEKLHLYMQKYMN